MNGNVAGAVRQSSTDGMPRALAQCIGTLESSLEALRSFADEFQVNLEGEHRGFAGKLTIVQKLLGDAGDIPPCTPRKDASFLNSSATGTKASPKVEKVPGDTGDSATSTPRVSALRLSAEVHKPLGNTGDAVPEPDGGDSERATPVTKKKSVFPEALDMSLNDIDEFYNQVDNSTEENMAGLFGLDSAEDQKVVMYRVKDLYHDTGFAQMIARSKYFENLTSIVVAANAIWMGCESDYNSEENKYDGDLFWPVSSNIFCVFFVLELFVRFLSFHTKSDCLRDSWFKFDLFLVATMVIDEWVMEVYLKISNGQGPGFSTQPLRVLRLARIMRMARLMQSFPELVTMMKGMIRSLRAIGGSMILVTILTYVCAILLHTLLKGDDELNGYVGTTVLWWGRDFSTMSSCMVILFLHGGLMLDNTAPLMSTLLYSKWGNATHILAGLLFTFYLLLTAMLILQMLVGILCDVVTQVGKEKRTTETLTCVREDLLSALEACDDGNGKISQDELMNVMKVPESKACLRKLNISELFLMELTKLMYPRHDTEVAIQDILDLLVLCRGENEATVATQAAGFCFLERVVETTYHKLARRLDTMDAKMGMSIAC